MDSLSLLVTWDAPVETHGADIISYLVELKPSSAAAETIVPVTTEEAAATAIAVGVEGKLQYSSRQDRHGMHVLPKRIVFLLIVRRVVTVRSEKGRQHLRQAAWGVKTNGTRNRDKSRLRAADACALTVFAENTALSYLRMNERLWFRVTRTHRTYPQPDNGYTIKIGFSRTFRTLGEE